MHIVQPSGSIAALVPVLLLAASCAGEQDAGTGKHRLSTPKRFSSPEAAFDAYREARRKQAWRKCFSCLTPDCQNDAVFETFFGCAMRDSEESRAIVKKYVDLAAVGSDYERKYKEKHGVDLRKLTSRHGTDAKSVRPKQDRDLMQDALAANVKDKAGFYDAAGKLFAKKKPDARLGKLEQVVIRGDTATGRAPLIRLPSEKAEKSRCKTFKFRKINGGWLLDSR